MATTKQCAKNPAEPVERRPEPTAASPVAAIVTITIRVEGNTVQIDSVAAKSVGSQLEWDHQDGKDTCRQESEPFPSELDPTVVAPKMRNEERPSECEIYLKLTPSQWECLFRYTDDSRMALGEILYDDILNLQRQFDERTLESSLRQEERP